ncbi:MAG: aminotransferase class I/II-fold pyridoxal phosphate-dependent enzyme [Alphaproteobacteria bacterium]|nr:aminotransferase class I/II-fold pyridoxal phosphate-dependent enzyme [Alphaproteobacteria bacterium]
MKTEPDKFCKAPFRGLTIDNDGTLMPCCEFMRDKSDLPQYKIWEYQKYKDDTTLRQKMIDGEIDGLIVASPANPTGTMISADEMAALTSYCDDRGIRLISDEIYHGITYEMPGVTALTHTDNAFVVNSFSKYYSMTGWRVGWMVIPEQLHRSVECLAQNIFISVPALSQHAASAAFDCTAELDENVARYAANRELLLRELPKAGLTKLAPADGAFYIYADVSHLTNDSEDFCRRMLTEAGIATAPGTDFDRDRGRSAIRISFAGDTQTMSDAAGRLKDWIEG